MNRRKFIGFAGSSALFLLACGGKGIGGSKGNGEFLFVEAEGFADKGGWELDQQSMDIMGSPFLLAHGLGIPVKDAVTSVNFPSTGKYKVWVRTKDWVAPWKAPGAPGKFQLVIDGKAVPEIFGTKGAEWHWHDGGMVDIKNKNATIALHDLTGFEGRCEAILFCKGQDFIPSNDKAKLNQFRRKLSGLPLHPKSGGSYDFAVIGGGLAGTCAAISAARNGLKVALVQDRPVLGGNCSSEVRVWPEGITRQKPFENIGQIVEELLPSLPAKVNDTRNALPGKFYDDAKKMDVVRREPNITLFMNERAIEVKKNKESITSVIIQNTVTGIQQEIQAKLFADCTGDAVIGYLAGADYEMASAGIMGMSNLWNVLNAADKNAVLKCECRDKTTLALQCGAGNAEQPFPRTPWAIDLSDKPFPGRKGYKGQWGAEDPLANLGGWFWESGFDRNPIMDVELIRDLNFRAMYGTWDALKNVDKLYPNYRLGWAAFIAGKRESRRLLGDVILTADDFRKGKDYNDPAFPCSWHIDLHKSDSAFDREHPKEDAFISKATEGDQYTYKIPYWAPYRVLYSRNISNLFMAGRNISVTQNGLGPVRVMRTCGMMGEVVGKAASLCIFKKTTPRGVYQKYFDDLKKLMKEKKISFASNVRVACD